jgi:hypothetical protein
MSGEQIALMVIGLLLGGFEQIRLVDWFKAKLNVEGLAAKFLAAAVAVALSIGSLFLAGEVGLADFNIENFPVVFASVWGLAEMLYFYRKNGSA